MNKLSAEKFLQALEICKSLDTVQRKPSNLPCEAIELFCDLGKEPANLLHLCQQHAAQIEPALEAIANYAASVDNWKHGDCPLGVKDHCNILHFFLNVHTQNFKFFRGQNFTPEVICSFLHDWKGIYLTVLLEYPPPALTLQGGATDTKPACAD
ncbi:MAG: hypothetical protein GDA56_06930 [Hormoscilla sp. GM7CHS1pb]|nr:hypothetical protein [Hormoscilla sp. GM7CHS1pb]